MEYKIFSEQNAKMEYRRFGKTNKIVSVITLGGMRYKNGWNEPREELPQETIEQCKDTVEKALKNGINLIETAYGYKKSEHLYGKVLNNILKVNRSSYFLMTKGNPTKAEEVRPLIEKQLIALKTDYIDFYAWHGINSNEILENITKNGVIGELLKLKDEGIIKHLGFSTHGALDVIENAINTNYFEFVNLHYYYFFQHNKPAINLAAKKDLGVFIISPNDKGGQLSTPPQKLMNLTKPYSPIQWNAKFCLSNPNIHTLTFGLPVTSSFNQLVGIFPISSPLSNDQQQIKEKLDDQKKLDPYADFDGYEMLKDPSGINIPEVLRFRKMWKCYDMKDFGIYRYNMFKENDYWFQGAFPNKENLKKIDLSKCPANIPIINLIKETHEALYKQKKE